MTLIRPNYRLTFAVLLLGIAAYALLQSLVLPVLSILQHNLHTSPRVVTWVLTVYLLSASVFTPILGRVGDLLGKGRVFVGALIALAIGSLMGALAGSIDLLLLARAVQGIGGGVLPLAFGIIRDEFPAAKTPAAIGAASALAAVGTGAGVVLAGPIVVSIGYHWLFWVPMIMALLAATSAYVVLPSSAITAQGKIGLGAAVLLSVWLIALLVALSEGEVWGWLSGRTDGLLVVSVVVAAAWAHTELRSGNPTIDIRMMRAPTVWTSNLTALLFGVGMYPIFAFVPQFVQTKPAQGYGFGASSTVAGLFLLPLAALMFGGGLASSSLSARFGAKRMLCVGAAACIAPFIILVAANRQPWEIYLAMGILGAGFGTAFSIMSNLIVQAVPISQTGAATGMNANIRTIGGSIGAALMTSLIASSATADGTPKESGYTHGFAVLAAATALAALVALLVPSRPLERERVPHPTPVAAPDASGAIALPGP